MRDILHNGQKKNRIKYLLAAETVAAVILLAVFCLPLPVAVGENIDISEIEKQLEDNVQNSLDKLDISDLIDFDSVVGDSRLYDGGIAQLINDILDGRFGGSPAEVFDLVLSLLGVSLKGLLPMMITLVSIAVLFSILSGMSGGFINKSINEIIYFVCYAAMSVLIITSVSYLVKNTVDTINTMAKFMDIVFPLLITLVTALGGVVTAGVYQPFMAVLSVGISAVIKGVVLPCFIATMALSVVGHISSDVRLEKLTKFFKSAGSVVLGFAFSIFMSFITVQGVTGAVSDSISVKSAKFAISSYVPILGGYLSDGFDLVLASIVLVKNSIGMCGVIVMLSLILSPIVNMTIYLLGLRLISGIIEPIGDKRMSSIVYGISDNLTLLIAGILGMAFMFFITVTLIIMTCNLGV